MDYGTIFEEKSRTENLGRYLLTHIGVFVMRSSSNNLAKFQELQLKESHIKVSTVN